MWRTILERVPFPLMLLVLAGCRDNPDASLCVIYTTQDKPALFCQNMKTGETSELTLDQAHKYYAMSAKDYETVREWYRKECQSDGR